MSGDLDACKRTFWEKMIPLLLMYPISFVEGIFSGSRSVLQTDFGAVVARDLNQRGALRREDVYSLGNSHRILADLQLEEDTIFISQWISISLFEHLKNGALGPLSL